MIIINENFRIENDDLCYTLQERKISKKDSVERWDAVSYHKTPQNALLKYRNLNFKRLLRTGEDILINELITKLVEEDERLIQALKGENNVQ